MDWYLCERDLRHDRVNEYIEEWMQFVLDAVSYDQYLDMVEPPSAEEPVPVPTPSPVKNGMSLLTNRSRYINP